MKNSKLIKIVAVIVVAAFLWQNVASANPDIMHARMRSVTDTLAPELSLASKHGLELKGLMSLIAVAREALYQDVRQERLKDFIGLDPDIPEEIVERIDFSDTDISSARLKVSYIGNKGKRTLMFSLLEDRSSVSGISDAPGRIVISDMVIEIDMPKEGTTGTSPPDGEDVTGSSEGNIARHEGKKELNRSILGRLLRRWNLLGREGVNDVIRKYWKKGTPKKGCTPLKEKAAIISMLSASPETEAFANSLLEKKYQIYVYDVGRADFVEGISTHYGIRTGSIHITKHEYDRLKGLGIRHLAARIAHEVCEIDMWRENAQRLMEKGLISGVGIAPKKYDENWAKGIRLWIRSNSDNSGEGLAQQTGEDIHHKGLAAEMAVLAETVIKTKKDLESEEYYRSVSDMASKFLTGGVYRKRVADQEEQGKKPQGLYAELYDAIIKALKHFKNVEVRKYFADILWLRADLYYTRSMGGGLKDSLDKWPSAGTRSTLILARLQGLRKSIKKVKVIDDATYSQVMDYLREVESLLPEQHFSPDINKGIVGEMVDLEQIYRAKNKKEWNLPRMFDPKDAMHAAVELAETGEYEEYEDLVAYLGDKDEADDEKPLGEIESANIASAIRDQEREVQILSTDAIIAMLDGTGNWNRKEMLSSRKSGTKSRSSNALVPLARTAGSKSKSKLLQPGVETKYGGMIERVQTEADYVEKIDAAKRSAKKLITHLPEVTNIPVTESRLSKIFYGSPTGYFDVNDLGKDYPHVVDITIIVNGERSFSRRNIPAERVSAVSADLAGVESINIIAVGTETMRNAFLEEGPIRILDGGIINFDERMEVQKLFLKVLKEDIQVAGAGLINVSHDFDKDVEKLEKAYVLSLLQELGVAGREIESLEERRREFALQELSKDDQAIKLRLERELEVSAEMLSSLEEEKERNVAESMKVDKTERAELRAARLEIYGRNDGNPTQEDLLEDKALSDKFNARVARVNSDRERIKTGISATKSDIANKTSELKAIEELAKKSKEHRDGFNRKEVGVRRNFQLLRKRIEDIQYGKGLIPGVVINDRYKVMNKLGEGGFGAVYRVLDTDSGDEKAIKMLLPPSEIRPDQMKRAQLSFEKEKETLRRLSGPAVQVPTISGEGMYGGSPYFVMTLVKGLTLKEIIKRLERGEFNLTAKDKLYLMHAVSKVLVGFHNAREIHRDIKPENLMIPVDENGEIAFPWRKRKRKDREDMDWLQHPEYEAFCRNIYIIDLGISLKGEEDSLGLTGDFRAKTMASVEGGFGSKQAVGTPRYMAPEQFAESGETSKTDVFALGVIFFQLWSYVFPYGNDAENQQLMALSCLNANRQFLCDMIEETNNNIRTDKGGVKDIDLKVDEERLKAIRYDIKEDILSAKVGSKVMSEMPDGTLKWNMRALGEKTLKKRLASIPALDDEERAMVFSLVYPFLPEADGYVEALIGGMVSKEEVERPTSLEVLSETEKYLTGRFEKMAYRPRGEIIREGIGARVGRWLDKRKGALATTLFVVVMALGGVITLLYKLYVDARDERALAEAEKNKAKIEMIELNKSKREAEENRIAAEAAVRALEKREKQLESKKADLERAKELIEKDKSSAEEARTTNAQKLKEKEEEIEAVKAALVKVTGQLGEARGELVKLRKSVSVVFEDAKNSVMNHDLDGAFEILSERISWWAIDKDNLNKYTLGYDEISDIMVDSGAIKKALELEEKRIQLLTRAKDWHPNYTKEDKAVFEEAVFQAKMRRIGLLRLMASSEAVKAADALLEEEVVAGSKNWSEKVMIVKIGIMLDEVPSLKPGKKRDYVLEELASLIKKIGSDDLRDMYYGFYYDRTSQLAKAESYFRKYSSYWKKQAASEGIDPAERTKRERKAAYGLLLAAEVHTRSAFLAKQNGEGAVSIAASNKAKGIIDELVKEHADQSAVLGWAHLMKGDLESLEADTQDAREAHETGLKHAASSGEKALVIILSRRLKQKTVLKDLSGALSDRFLLPYLYLKFAKLMVAEEAANRKAAFERAKMEAERKKQEEAEAKRREEERIKREKELREAKEAARKLREEALAGIKEYKDARIKLEHINKEIAELRGKRKNESDAKKLKAIDQQIERALKKKGIVEDYIKKNPPKPEPKSEPEKDNAPENNKPNPEPVKDGAKPKDPKQKGVGNVVDEAPDHRLLNALIKCAAEEGMITIAVRDHIEVCRIGNADFENFMDVYKALTHKERVWEEFKSACSKDYLTSSEIDDLYSDGMKKLVNISGHAGLREDRVFVVAGFPKVEILIAHEIVEMKIHQEKAISMVKEVNVASWQNLTDREKKMLVNRLREWAGYNDFAELAHSKAMKIVPVDGAELIADREGFYGESPGVDLSSMQLPITGGIAPVVDADILSRKVRNISSIYEKEMPSFNVQLQNALSKKGIGEGIILFADDIVDSSAVFDLKDVAERAGSDGSVLKKIVLYAKNGQKAEIVEKIILEANAKALVVVVLEEEVMGHYGREDFCKRSLVDSVIRYVLNANSGGIFARPEQIIGVIRGPLADGEDMETLKEELRRSSIKVPVVVFQDSRYGHMYSLVEAVVKLAVMRSGRKGSSESWIYILPPVRRLSEALQKGYREYITMLRALESAA